MAFFLKPSVGTWLVRRVHGVARPDATAVSTWQRSVQHEHAVFDDKLADIGFECSVLKKSASLEEGSHLWSNVDGSSHRPHYLLPSVGTWLMQRPPRTPKTAQSWSPRSWTADFSSAIAVAPILVAAKGAKVVHPAQDEDAAEEKMDPTITDFRTPTTAHSTSSGVDFQALGSGPLDFRVTVPPPYPGVQYRKSMNLEDRWPRYAQTDSIVTGIIKEKDGLEWLRVEANVFLPTKVGNITILQPAGDTPSGQQDRSHGGPRQQSSSVGKTQSGAPVVPLISRPTPSSDDRAAHAAPASAPRVPPAAAPPWWACCSICTTSAATDSEVIIREAGPTGNKPQNLSPTSGGASDALGQQRR